MKILHIITGLATGGSEMMLYKILSKINREQFQPVVLSLRDKGTLGDKIEALGIPVYALGINSKIATILAISKLMHLINQVKPDIIQGWMYHGNFVAQLAIIGNCQLIPIVWNIRQSLYSLKFEKKSTAVIIKILSYLSKLPATIIYNSKTSAVQHQNLGYCATQSLVIPNGFDTNLFSPSNLARLSLRQELGLEKDIFMIGIVARFHPMKDHNNFLQAAANLLKHNPDIHFVLAGRNVDQDNLKLVQLIEQLGIKENTHLLGERQDIPLITAALDLATCSSYTEAFPNVIGEAMSCGVPCVVTDVGDSASIVSDTGQVVPPSDPEALCAGWLKLIALEADARRELGTRARQRIEQLFSLENVVQQYEKLYQDIVYG
ncbi:MAG: glycosyltransferase [Symploca sp. SIO2D2]|nr:glycosyltransferase [Symploca sp. SIO2D2]